MNKRKKIIIAVSFLILLLAGYGLYKLTLGNHDSKVIQITIQNEDDVIYDKQVETNSATLGELLEEMKKQKEILLESEQSTYGMYITGMGVDELYVQDEASGKYWTYDSENNAQCVKNSFCDAADVLVIEDKDHFTFTLEAYE